MTMKHAVWIRRLGSLLLAGLLVSALVKKDLLLAALKTNPYQGSSTSVARGEALWVQHCFVCHGADGVGDGPVAAQLPVKPKDLTLIALPPIFPDGIVAFRIAYGKNTMPAWGEAFSPDEIWDLVSFIRSKSKKLLQPPS